MERPGQFEGYIMMIFKNVSIRQSNENPKGCLVSYIHHNSSINMAGHMSETDVEVSDEGMREVNIIAKQPDEEPLTINNTFNFLLQHLSPDEVETLNLLVDKKKTKGRYTSEVKDKVDALKLKIAELMPEFTEHYQYTSEKERKFKTDKEIEESLETITNKNKRNQHDR